MDFVPSVTLKGIDSLIEKHGELPEKLMLDVGFAPTLLERPDNPVDGQLFNDLIEHSARTLNQRFFGLQLADIQGASILGPLWFLIRNSSTIEEAIENLVKNYASHTLITYWDIKTTPEGLLLIYDVNPEIKGEYTQAVELGLGITCANLRRYLGSQWRPRAVYLRCVEPYEKRPLIEAFGRFLYFKSEVNAILLTHEELKQPLSDASELQQRHYERLMASKSDFTPRSIVIQAENIINTSITRHKCTANFVAKCLNLNPRTLRYQLQQQGTSFQELLAEAKLNIALRYLKESTLSVTDISERLHFSEIAVFSRFIKKNTGLTPKELREGRSIIDINDK